jgi:hypothetical protein
MAATGKHYFSMHTHKAGEKVTFEPYTLTHVLAPRSFIVSFSAEISLDPDKLGANLVRLCDEEHKHFHGLSVLDSQIFATRLPNEFKPPRFRIEVTDGLTHFLRMFLISLRDYPMDAMDVERYIGR